jgi:hypothetical protein
VFPESPEPLENHIDSAIFSFELIPICTKGVFHGEATRKSKLGQA